LNNITSLLEIDKEKARESTLRLGDLMAYMVYEADEDFVPLEKEISYIQNFIALQSLRIDKKEFVRFQVEGEPGEKEIGSMLLIPFVENSFKYCDANECPGIFMGLKIMGDKIIFKIENRVSEEKEEFSKQGGFGLENVKKRLEQLYPKSFRLQAGFVKQFYKVKLEIDLSGRKKF
jgi:LytS/YehU family sensor histidine kinase